MEFKEIIKQVRKEIKEAYKGHKVSVTKVQSGYHYKMDIEIDGAEKDELDKAREIIRKYQDSRDSDPMTDYYNYNFYYLLNGGI